MTRAEESYAIACELGDARAQWRAMQFLGEVGIANEQRMGDAATWLERGLELSRREGFAAAEAIGVYTLGVVRWVLGDLVAAEALLEESLLAFRALVESGSEERLPSLTNIAEMRSSDPTGGPRLRVVFEETLQPFADISCGAAVGYVLTNLAGVARAAGEFPRARALLDEAADRFVQTDDDRGRADVMVRRGYLALSEGLIPEGRACLEHALDLRRQQHDRRGVGLALAGLGLIDTTAGEYEKAERHLAEARDIFKRAGDRWGLGSTLWRIADLALARNRLDEAAAALEEARVILGETHRERWIAHTLAGLAEIAALQGDTDRAAELFRDVLARYAASDDEAGIASAEARLEALAKKPLRAGKSPRSRTRPSTTRKGSTT